MCTFRGKRSNMSKKFEQQLAELGITLTQTQFNQFDKYYEMLVEWNKIMNLTGITEYEEVNEKHFVDSLAIAFIYYIYTTLSYKDNKKSTVRL